MKTNVILVFLIAITFTSCKMKSEDFSNAKLETTTSKETNDEALVLFQQQCYACHSVSTKTHDEIIAPPMIAVKKRYLMQFGNKSDFVDALVAYAKDPKAENALMPGAIDKFKAMPKQAFEEDDLRKIAAYIYENKIETPEWFEDHFKENHKNGMGKGKGMGRNSNN